MGQAESSEFAHLNDRYHAAERQRNNVSPGDSAAADRERSTVSPGNNNTFEPEISQFSAGDGGGGGGARPKKKGIRRQSWLIGGNGKPPPQRLQQKQQLQQKPLPTLAEPEPPEPEPEPEADAHLPPADRVRLRAQRLANVAETAAVQRITSLRLNLMERLQHKPQKKSIYRSTEPQNSDDNGEPSALERLTFKMTKVPGLPLCLVDEVDLHPDTFRLIKKLCVSMTAELKYDAAVQAVAGQGEGDMWHDLSVETCSEIIADVLGVSDDEPRRVWRAIDEQREGENYYSTTTRWRKLSVDYFKKRCAAVAHGFTNSEGNIERSKIENFMLTVALTSWLDGRNETIARTFEKMVSDNCFRHKMKAHEQLAVAIDIVKSNTESLLFLPQPTIAEIDAELAKSASAGEKEREKHTIILEAPRKEPPILDTSNLPLIVTFLSIPGGSAWGVLPAVCQSWRRVSKRVLSVRPMRRSSSSLADLYSQKFTSQYSGLTEMALQDSGRDMASREQASSSELRALAALRSAGDNWSSPLRAEKNTLSVVYEKHATAKLAASAARNVSEEKAPIMDTETAEVEARVEKLERLLEHKKRLLSQAQSRLVDGGSSDVDEMLAQNKVRQLVKAGRQIRRLMLTKERLERELKELNVEEVEEALAKYEELQTKIKEEKEKVQELEVANEVLALEYGRENARMAMAQARLEEVKQEAQDAKASYAKDFTECHRYIGLSTKFPSNLKAPSPLDPSEEEQFPRDRFAAAEEAMQAAMRELYEKTEEEKRIAAALRAATAKFNKKKVLPESVGRTQLIVERHVDVSIAEREFQALYESTMAKLSLRYVPKGVNVADIARDDPLMVSLGVSIDPQANYASLPKGGSLVALHQFVSSLCLVACFSSQGVLRQQHEQNLYVARAVESERTLEKELADQFDRIAGEVEAKVKKSLQDRQDRAADDLAHRRRDRRVSARLSIQLGGARSEPDDSSALGKTHEEGEEEITFSGNPLFGGGGGGGGRRV
jgi:hypothetical protein